MGIQGEGEKSFIELLKRMDEGRDFSGVPGLYISAAASRKRAFAKELDEFPLPDTRSLSAARYHDQEFWLPVSDSARLPNEVQLLLYGSHRRVCHPKAISGSRCKMAR